MWPSHTFTLSTFSETDFRSDDAVNSFLEGDDDSYLGTILTPRTKRLIFSPLFLPSSFLFFPFLPDNKVLVKPRSTKTSPMSERAKRKHIPYEKNR